MEAPAISSPVKETLLQENFWLQAEADTWWVGDLSVWRQLDLKVGDN